MNIQYEVITEGNSFVIKDLCNELMVYQKSKAHIYPEFFDGMCFETRMLSSIKSAEANYIIAARHNTEILGYAYSNISSKLIYTNNFATLKCDSFFDFNSVKNDKVGCLSQFFIKEGYRSMGIGSILFDRSLDWLKSFTYIDDFFIFVSNGNDMALKFYLDKGFKISHRILDGFITVLRNS